MTYFAQRFFGRTTAFAAGLVLSLALPALTAAADDEAPRRSSGPPPIVYDEFPNQCARCHKSDGRGGPAYGGFAANLRETELDYDGLVFIITEGIRQNGMPEFRSTLTKRQIAGISNYILDHFKGQPLPEDSPGNN